MTVNKKLATLIICTLSLVLLTGWMTGRVSAFGTDYYFEVQRNIEIFGRVYQEISKKYVEEVDPENFMKAGIEGMLATLDPYTVLVEKEDSQELQIMSSGKYGGLGMRIGLRGNWPTVVEPPFDGTPAIKAGIREGDRIIEVDGEGTKDMSVNGVAGLLRGEIGSEVFLKIERAGESAPIEFRLVRAEIVVTDVAYSGIIKDGIGLIRLSHFSRNAGKDIEKSIRKLKEQGLNSLILDLRSNPGGLLDAAINVSENFIKKGKLIVSTEGRTTGSVQKYHAEKDPILEDMPLAVLVNGYSASASEIVSGAIQDLDRGVIVGRRTFGKGLVQTVIPITGEAALKITTAKYLVPSGRSIQDPKRFLANPEDILFRYSGAGKPDKKLKPGKDEENADEGAAFLTEHGRKVYSSHGVVPDVEIESIPLSRFELELLRKTMPFQFAVVYAANHPELTRDFEVTEAMISEFQDFLTKKGFQYKSEGEIALGKLSELAEHGAYLASISTSMDEIQNVLAARKTVQFDESLEFIRQELKQEIAAKLWGSKAETEATFEFDPVARKAIEILSDPETYRQILSPAEK